MINKLKGYQDWRMGKDERTMEDAGIIPKDVTKTLDWAIEQCEDNAKLKAQLECKNDEIDGLRKLVEVYKQS